MSQSDLDTLQGNIVATFHAGAFFGALITFPLSDKIGRRKAILVFAWIFLLGAVLMTASHGKVGMIIAGRAVAGLGIGAVSMTVPVYIAELSPPSIRGRLIGLWEVCSQGGGMCGFWVNYAVDKTLDSSTSTQWMVPMGLQLIPAALLFVGMIFCPESPRWLIKNDNWEEATKVLTEVRKLPVDCAYIRRELSEIRLQVDETNSRQLSKSQVVRRVFSKGTRNRVGTALILAACQNLMGTNIVTYYSPRIFGSLGITGTSTKLLATGFYGFVKTLGVILFSIWAAEKVGRRKGLVLGASLASLPMWYIGGYVYVTDPTKRAASGYVHPDGAGYFAVVCIFVYALILCMTWQGITWVYSSEIFPIDIRMFCVAITIANGWLWSFFISEVTPHMISGMGYGTYMFFAALLVVMAIWSFFFIPETKGEYSAFLLQLFMTDFALLGLPLEEMDVLFSRSMHKAAWNQLRGKGMRPQFNETAARRDMDVRAEKGYADISQVETRQEEK